VDTPQTKGSHLSSIGAADAEQGPAAVSAPGRHSIAWSLDFSSALPRSMMADIQLRGR
jgi:hypothetical protein